MLRSIYELSAVIFEHAKELFVAMNDVLHNGNYYLATLLQPQIRFWTKFAVWSFVPGL